MDALISANPMAALMSVAKSAGVALPPPAGAPTGLPQPPW
jgi:hypothetical protein